MTLSGKADTTGRMSNAVTPVAVPGSWRQHVHKESARNTGSPKAWSGTTNRTPVTAQAGRSGVAERLVVCAGQRVVQEGSSPSGARMRSVISERGGNASRAGERRKAGSSQSGYEGES